MTTDEALEPEWHPIGAFPTGSEDSLRLQQWVGQLSWMGLGPDFPDDPGIPPVFVALGKADDGRLICTGLIIGEIGNFSSGTRELTARALRQIRIPELITFVKRAEGQHSKARELVDSAPAVGRKPRGKGQQFLQDVARDYRRALEVAPSRPTAWLAEQYGVPGFPKPAATVRRWLKQARDAGYLGEGIRGKPGEGPLD